MKGVLRSCIGALMALGMFWSSGSAAQGPEPEAARALVQETAEATLQRLGAEQQALERDPTLIYGLVEDVVLPHFDFERMSQLVLGRHWRTATAEQRARFTAEFRTLLVRTYARALLEYTDQQIRYLPLHAGPGDRTVTVRTEIVQSAGPSIPINYALYFTGDRWKVYDIVVDGVSLVTNYRSSFNSQIRQGGLDQLIAEMVENNRQKGGSRG